MWICGLFLPKYCYQISQKSYLVHPHSDETVYNGPRKSLFHLLVSQLWRPFLAFTSFTCECSLCYYSILQHSLQIFLEYPHYDEYSPKPWRCSRKKSLLSWNLHTHRRSVPACFKANHPKLSGLKQNNHSFMLWDCKLPGRFFGQLMGQ